MCHDDMHNDGHHHRAGIAGGTLYRIVSSGMGRRKNEKKEIGQQLWGNGYFLQRI